MPTYPPNPFKSASLRANSPFWKEFIDCDSAGRIERYSDFVMSTHDLDDELGATRVQVTQLELRLQQLKNQVASLAADIPLRVEDQKVLKEYLP